MSETPTADQLVELQRLRDENEALRHIAMDLQFCARRYADGRSTYIVSLVNGHTRWLLEHGVILDYGKEGTVWAADGMGRSFDHLTKEQLTPFHPDATGESFRRRPEYPDIQAG